MIPSFFEDQIPIISLENRELPLFYLWDSQIFCACFWNNLSWCGSSSHCNCLNPSSWLFNKHTTDEGNYALHWTIDYLKTETHLTVLKIQDNFLKKKIMFCFLVQMKIFAFYNYFKIFVATSQPFLWLINN